MSSIVEVTSSCPVFDSFRVRQIAGMFDVPLSQRATVTVRGELPELDEPWQIGLIVGPSGSGKTTIARRFFGESYYAQPDWPRGRAVIDCFGELPIKKLTALLTAVGFSSPPSWVKPFEVLSVGEQFRCNLARALASVRAVEQERSRSGDSNESSAPLISSSRAQPPLVVFDEFTSAVDRRSARVGAAAVSRAIRQGAIRCRLVAVTCHYDIARWLQPDWFLDMADGQLVRSRLRRPPIRLRIYRCARDAWRLFARHHYLSGSLSPTARAFIALWGHEPVAFCATIPLIGRRGHWRITRLVTLPEYQGIGIGLRVAEAVAELHIEDGLRINITASHPAVIAHCARSPHWRTVRVTGHRSRNARPLAANYRSSAGRAVASFEYVKKTGEQENR